MVARDLIRTIFFLIMVFALTGCNLPAVTGTQVNVDQIRTAAAQTIEATFTIGALANTFSQSTLTNTPVPKEIEPSATVVDLTPVIVPSATITNTTTQTTPTDTPIPIIVNTPVVPMIHSTMSTNCRSGPSSSYDVVGYLLVGDKVEVRGKNSNATWWYIRNPADTSGYCWVWNQTTVVEGNQSIIPVVTPVATVTPEVATLTITSKAVPVNYTGPCPVNIVLTSKITANRPVKVEFTWTSDFGYPFTADEFIFDISGSQKFTETMTIASDTTGYVRFRITSPYLLKGDRINIMVNCLP